MIKKITKMMILMMGGIYYLNAQSYQPYMVSDPHWVMGRHDVKRTGFNPIRCTSPANVSRTWIHATAGSDGNEVNTIIPPGRVFSSGNALSATDNNLNLVMYNAYNGSIIWYRSSPGGADLDRAGCVYAYNNLVFCQWYDEASDPWSSDKAKAQLFDANNGNILWTSGTESNNLFNYVPPAVYNIGTSTIVFRAIGSNAVAARISPVNPYYQVYWSVNLGGGFLGAPTILRIRNDTPYVLYPVSSNPGKIVALNIYTGTTIWTWNLPSGKTFSRFHCRPYECSFISGYDVDNDGKDEIFVRYDSFLVMLKEVSGNPQVIWTRKLNAPLHSAIALGPILPNNKWGIAVIPTNYAQDSYSFIHCGNRLVILDAITGSVAYSIALPGNYCNSPTIADVNADGIYDVIIASWGCSNPIAYSSSNNFSSPVWQSTGCSQAAPLSSDIAVGLIDTVMAFSIGDESCYTNVWLCKHAITPVSKFENWDVLKYKVVKDGIEFIGRGSVKIYRLDGSLIGNYEVNGFRKILLLKGVYMVRINKENKKVIIN